MQFDIRARNFLLTDDLRSHAETRLYFTMARCDERIKQVVMQLSEVTASHGVGSKCCDLRLMLAGLPDVLIENIDTDPYVAIDGAIDRARRKLTCKVSRQKSLLRKCRRRNRHFRR